MAERKGIPVRIIPESVAGMIMNSRLDTVMVLKTVVDATAERLGLEASSRAKPYSPGGSVHASLHDFKRWCDSLTAEDKESVAIFQRIQSTVNKRVS